MNLHSFWGPPNGYGVGEWLRTIGAVSTPRLDLPSLACVGRMTCKESAQLPQQKFKSLRQTSRHPLLLVIAATRLSRMTVRAVNTYWRIITQSALARLRISSRYFSGFRGRHCGGAPAVTAALGSSPCGDRHGQGNAVVAHRNSPPHSSAIPTTMPLAWPDHSRSTLRRSRSRTPQIEW